MSLKKRLMQHVRDWARKKRHLNQEAMADKRATAEEFGVAITVTPKADGDDGKVIIQ